MHTFVRRAVEAVVAGDNPDAPPIEISPLVGTVVAATTIFFILFMTSVRYTLWAVVGTLTCVEEPSTTVIVTEEKPSAGHPDALAEETVDSVVVIQNQPVTRRIKATIKHLVSRGGIRARWRGLAAFAVYGIAQHFTAASLRRVIGLFVNPYVFEVLGFPLSRPVAALLSHVLLARIAMTWTHVVISAPSSKPWYRRLPDRQAWKNVVPATITADLAAVAPFVFAIATMLLIDVDSEISVAVDQGTPDVKSIAFKALTVLIVALSAFIGLTIPAFVSLIRVQASMLPEDDDAIVEFDRSFGGKVVPRVLGGSGALKLKDAWASVSHASRLRIFKMLVKLVMIEFAMHVFYAGIIVVELLVLIGPETLTRMGRNGAVFASNYGNAFEQSEVIVD